MAGDAATETSDATLCGAITLYNPDESVFEHIDSYVERLNRLYVIDNSPAPSTAVHHRLARYPNITVLSKSGNLGIATALNMAAREGLAEGHAWMLTMDQDSYFDAEQLERLVYSLDSVDNASTAIVAATYEIPEEQGGPCRLEEKLTVITSGNFLNLVLAEQIGFFDERLFIDEVDHDYCLRANLKGFKVLLASNCFFFHQIGERVERRFLWKLKLIHEHSPQRFYFIVRNNLYMRASYGRLFPDYMRRNRRKVRRRMIQMIKYSPRRREYLHYYALAKRHFREGIFGNAIGLGASTRGES